MGEQLQLRNGKDAWQFVKTESNASIEVQTIQQLYKGIKVEHARVNAGTITVINQPIVKTTLRTSGLAAGTYLVQIDNGEKIETQKLVIRRD